LLDSASRLPFSFSSSFSRWFRIICPSVPFLLFFQNPKSAETNTDSQDAGFDLLKAALGDDSDNNDEDLEETAGFGAVYQVAPPNLPPKTKRTVPLTPGSPGQAHRRLPQPPSQPRSQTHAAASRINGHQHASATTATTASSGASPRTAATATDSDSFGTEYASRAEMLQRRKQQDAEIKARAAKLAAQTVDTSTETVYKALAPVPSMSRRPVVYCLTLLHLQLTHPCPGLVQTKQRQSSHRRALLRRSGREFTRP
jgi:hypothetical protein